MQAIGEHFNSQPRLFEVKPPGNKTRKKSNYTAIKEEIWDEIKKRDSKKNQKRYYVLLGYAMLEGDWELLSIKKWAMSTDNFVRAFYGRLKTLRYERNPKFWPDA